MLWIKALHVVAVISWMAGMLYLPRLYVYHCDAVKDGEADRMLQVMERRLLRFIMNPAMIVTWASGLYLAIAQGFFSEGWLHGKLLLVLLMSGCHGMLAKYRRQFADGNYPKSARFFRVFNEIPTLLMIGIVVLVIVKPF